MSMPRWVASVLRGACAIVVVTVVVAVALVDTVPRLTRWWYPHCAQGLGVAAGCRPARYFLDWWWLGVLPFIAIASWLVCVAWKRARLATAKA
jgi:hypothetical protein